MADTLVFLALSAIHSESIRLFREASDVECRKERRKLLRKLQRHPTVRQCRIISASAGYECGFPKDLNSDERSLKCALMTNLGLKLELQDFELRVLSKARSDVRLERWYSKGENDWNQHPDFDLDPAPDTLIDILRQLDFEASDEYREMGKTYSWYLHRYDERPPFADVTTHGRCRNCYEGLPVWRNCERCASAYFIDECDDIYVRCMECWSPEHQKDLTEVTRCQDCGGPPNLVIEKYEYPEETGLWCPDDPPW